MDLSPGKASTPWCVLFSCCSPPASSSTDDAAQKHVHVEQDVASTMGSMQQEIESLNGTMADIAAAKVREVRNLQKELETAKTKSDGLSAERDSLRRRMETLEGDVAEVAAAKDSETGNLREELEGVRRSLIGAATAHDELSAENGSLRRQIETLIDDVAEILAAKEAEVEDSRREAKSLRDRLLDVGGGAAGDGDVVDGIAAKSSAEPAEPGEGGAEKISGGGATGVPIAALEEATAETKNPAGGKMKKKKKLRPRLAPLRASSGSLGDEMGLGYGHIAVSTRTLFAATQSGDDASGADEENDPVSATVANWAAAEIAKPEEGRAKKKKLRPRLTPRKASSGDLGDEEGLGYGHIAVSTRTLLATTQSGDDSSGIEMPVEKKKRRPRLSPQKASSGDLVDDEGLGYGHIAVSTRALLATTQSGDDSSGIDVAVEKKKQRPRLAPRRASSGDLGDEEGLGYGHIAVSTRTLFAITQDDDDSSGVDEEEPAAKFYAVAAGPAESGAETTSDGAATDDPISTPAADAAAAETTKPEEGQAKKKKKKKKLRPRLAPRKASLGDLGNEEGLGYGHIAVSTRTLFATSHDSDDSSGIDEEGPTVARGGRRINPPLAILE